MKKLLYAISLCLSTLSVCAAGFAPPSPSGKCDIVALGERSDGGQAGGRLAFWPDGTPVDAWFSEQSEPRLADLGTPYVLTDFGVENDSTKVQTKVIQAVIDIAATNGTVMGGRPERAVVVVPAGTYLTGALFLRPGVNLWISEGATLKGSDDIADFPVVQTRIEGQSCKYFAALINADSLANATIAGPGTIDGNGLRYWRAFWFRRSWNPQCTNKDEQRPRLLYVANSSHVTIHGLRLQNSPFWTTHLYKSDHVRLSGLRITSPLQPVKAPSTDAIDIDACTDVHVTRCYMAVNDDAIALKGGKGSWADTAPENGSNERILIEDCEYGFCHGCLTCGSESIHNRNIVLRRIRIGNAARLLWLKMRPDTPQRYEYITVDGITGTVTNFLYVKPWTQFFDLQGRTDMPLSYADHITMQNCTLQCKTFFAVARSDQYRLSNFTFANLDIAAEQPQYDPAQIDGLQTRRLRIRQASDSNPRLLQTDQDGNVK